jgi:predicted nucleic acid-binding protein
MSIFVDTNVLLDVLAKREPFYADAARIWSLAERGKIESQVSVISFNNIYYVVRRVANRKAAENVLRLLRGVFVAVPLDTQILNQAIDAGFSDFEDAIQFYSAIHSGARYLVTRDPNHFPAAGLAVLSPAEYLAALEDR